MGTELAEPAQAAGANSSGIRISDLVANFKSDLAQKEIETSLRRAENTLAMRFMFHCWPGTINNLAPNKVRGNTKYVTLPRMELIPIYSWSVPVHHPKGTGFSYGGQTFAGAHQGGVGTVTTQRSQLAYESTRKLEKWYGARHGLYHLPSLTAETDAEKIEAFMLFAGVMANTRPIYEEGDGEPQLVGESVRGVDVLIEDLPEFLKLEAPKMLAYVLQYGVDYRSNETLAPGIPSGLYRLPPTAAEKGAKMIEDLKRNVSTSIRAAVNKDDGILVVTRGQLQGAAARVSGSKARLDQADEALLAQFPSFSMDTAVERATQANRGLVEAITSKGAGEQATTAQMLGAFTELLGEIRHLRLEATQRDERLARLEDERAAAEEAGDRATAKTKK